MRLLIPALCLALSPVAALADPAAGQKLLDQAEGALAAGDTAAAVLLLRQAYEADPDPRYIANLGVVYIDSGQYAEAAEAFERYLDSDPEPNKRAAAEAALAKLRPEGVVVSSPAGADVFVDGADTSAGQTPLRTRLLSGARAVQVRLDGYVDEDAALNVEPGTPFRLEVNLEPVPADPTSDRRTQGYIGLGVGGAALLGAGVLAFLTTSAVDEMDAADERSAFNAAQNQANLFGWGAIVAGAAGVAGLATGGYLVITADEARVEAHIGPTGVGLAGTF